MNYEGDIPYTLQWQESFDGGTSWSDIKGETGDTLTLKSVSNSKNNFKYRCVVNNITSTVESDPATLTVISSGGGGGSSVINPPVVDVKPPVIVTGPEDKKIVRGSSLILSIEAKLEDEGELSYQWYKNGEKIEGATSSSYKIDTKKAGKYTYMVEVTNTNNNVTGNKSEVVRKSVEINIDKPNKEEMISLLQKLIDKFNQIIKAA